MKNLNIGILNFATKEVIEICSIGRSFDAVQFEAGEIEPGKWSIFMENKYESENAWVWARDVVDNLKKKYWDEMKGCPIEAWGTYFEVNINETEREEETVGCEILENGFVKRKGDLISFGR